MTTTPEQLAAQLGIGQAVPQRITPWCRGMGCTEVLDWLLVDREDGSGLHALCTELVQPAVYAGHTEPDADTAAAIAVLREQAGAEIVNECDVDPATGGIPLGGPCTDPWCAKNGRPCGFDMAAHINAHGPAIFTNLANGPVKTEPEQPPAAKRCAECATEDPRPWCDCREGEQCAGPCRQRAHTPGRCQDHCRRWDYGHPCCLCGNASPTVLDCPAPPTASRKCAAQTAPVPASIVDEPKRAPEVTGQVPLTDAVPGPTFTAPAGLPGDSPLKAEIINIVRWYDSSRPRSLQRAIGMSEVGVDCLRRLAYSALGVPQANAVKDPWFAIVGTSVHAWLADALVAWNQREGNTSPIFHVEQRVTASDGTTVVSGSTDFYRNGLVGDHKIVGSTTMKKFPSDQYWTQVQINGLGWEQAGWPVDTVALLFYPRSGFLDHMRVWSQPYSREHALQALARLGSVKTTATLLGPAALPAQPDFAGCTFCPFYNPNLTAADGTGCPGR